MIEFLAGAWDAAQLAARPLAAIAILIALGALYVAGSDRS